jgi:hypothetical protein
MAELVSAQCGFCRKNFRLRPDQLGHQVLCPHCRTAVKIAPKTDTAQEAIRALGGPSSPRDALAARHRPPRGRAGIRSKPVAIVWLILLVVASVGLIAFAAVTVMQKSARPEGPLAQGTKKPGFVKVPPLGVKPGTAPPAPAEVQPAPELVQVEKYLWGFKGRTRTYVCGKVTNITGKPIRVLTVSIPVMDKTKAKMGDATAIIRDLPADKSAPLVAVLDLGEGPEAGGFGQATYQIDPPGAAKPPVTLELDGVPWPTEDPGSEIMVAGTISQDIINRSATAVQTVEASAVIRNAAGKIVGAARDTVSLGKKLAKDQPATVKLRYEHCPASQIQTTEMWVQAAE